MTGRLVYSWLVSVFRLIISIFFRELVERGSHYIPADGPVMFVAAPHANQFIDPMIVYQTCRRQVSFLIAASSMRRRFVGLLARLLQSIPVERPADKAVRGQGSIFLRPDDSDVAIFGTTTRFTALAGSGGEKKALLLHLGSETFTAPIEAILSDNALSLARPFEKTAADALRAASLAEGLPYHVVSVVDQSPVYKTVTDILKDGGAVGLFPEGGSHDRAEMLPLKAGVAIMVLGTMAKYANVSVQIIPCGLNYFHPHRFRSRAIIEYGKPLHVDDALVKMYREGGDQKKEACSRLLGQIYDALCAVTLNVPDYETLQVVQAARRLYRPQPDSLATFQQLELTRRFVKGYLQHKNDPRVMELRRNILEYNRTVKLYGLKDHLVKKTAITGPGVLLTLLGRSCMLLVLAIAALPGTIVNLPALAIADHMSKKQAMLAKASSAVKIQGRDVIATWKILVALVLFPLLYVAYSAAVVFVLQRWKTGLISNSTDAWICFFSSLFCLPIMSSATLKLIEAGGYYYFSLRPLLMSLLDPNLSTVLRLMRQRLRIEINKLIDELGPTVWEDFEANRIVPRSRALSIPESPSHCDEASSFSKLAAQTKRIPPRKASPVLEASFEALDLIFSQYNYMRAKVGDLVGFPSRPDSPIDWGTVDPADRDDVFFFTSQTEKTSDSDSSGGV